jgi:hypothetical protein
MTIDNTIFREILLKRGTTAQNSTYTGPVGEVVVDTTLKTLRVQDGVTPGGWPLESSGLTGNLTANTLTITSTTASTTDSNGALIVAGGVGIGGNLNVGGPVTLNSAIRFANLTTTQINAITSITTGMTVYNYTTGNIQVYNGTKWANVTLS